MSGPAREGLALCQGLLLCGACSRRLSVRYKGNGGIYPVYECNYLRREGLSTKPGLYIRCDLVDNAVTKRVLEVLQPAEVDIALKAIHTLELRDKAVNRQWEMKIQRAEYEAQLAQRRYEEVDPSNRLVASTLESRWNQTLVNLEKVKKQYADINRLKHKPSRRSKKRKSSLRLRIYLVYGMPAPLERRTVNEFYDCLSRT